MVPEDALAASDGDPFLGRIVAGRFVVLRRLGAGSMGTVYRARQEAVARDVAVKILRSDRAIDLLARQRFVREAKAMSLLVSPHTVTVFDFGEMTEPAADGEIDEDGVSLFLAMELLDGESLGDRLKRVGRLPWRESLSIVREALLSLAEAHDKGVIHRDLKPDNLFLAKAPGGGEIVKVLDFGIAKVATDKSPMVDALETQAGTVFGTPRYMSPEQAQGRQLDARSDLYSLGVILYQMLVGRAPFVDDDAVVVMARHIKQKPTPPHEAAKDAQIPQPIAQLVMRVLSKDPADRPAGASAFASEIEAAERAASSAITTPLPDSTGSGSVAAVTLLGEGFGEGEAPVARPVEPAPAAEPTRRLRRTATLAAVLGGAALVAAGATLLAAPNSPSAPARPAISAAVRTRADALLTTLSASAASASPPPAGAPPAPGARPAPTSSAASDTTGRAAPAAQATAAPRPAATGKKPKYTRFD